MKKKPKVDDFSYHHSLLFNNNKFLNDKEINIKNIYKLYLSDYTDKYNDIEDVVLNQYEFIIDKYKFNGLPKIELLYLIFGYELDKNLCLMINEYCTSDSKINEMNEYLQNIMKHEFQLDHLILNNSIEDLNKLGVNPNLEVLNDIFNYINSDLQLGNEDENFNNQEYLTNFIKDHKNMKKIINSIAECKEVEIEFKLPKIKYNNIYNNIYELYLLFNIKYIDKLDNNLYLQYFMDNNLLQINNKNIGLICKLLSKFSNSDNYQKLCDTILQMYTKSCIESFVDYDDSIELYKVIDNSITKLKLLDKILDTKDKSKYDLCLSLFDKCIYKINNFNILQ